MPLLARFLRAVHTSTQCRVTFPVFFFANVVIRLCNSRFCANIIRQPKHGALAQLARVPVWQTGGQGFESPKLHHHKQTASQKRCRLFMVAQLAWERTCAQYYVKGVSLSLSRLSAKAFIGLQCAQVRRLAEQDAFAAPFTNERELSPPRKRPIHLVHYSRRRRMYCYYHQRFARLFIHPPLCKIMFSV